MSVCREGSRNSLAETESTTEHTIAESSPKLSSHSLVLAHKAYAKPDESTG